MLNNVPRQFNAIAWACIPHHGVYILEAGMLVLYPLGLGLGMSPKPSLITFIYVYIQCAAHFLKGFLPPLPLIFIIAVWAVWWRCFLFNIWYKLRANTILLCISVWGQFKTSLHVSNDVVSLYTHDVCHPGPICKLGCELGKQLRTESGMCSNLMLVKMHSSLSKCSSHPCLGAPPARPIAPPVPVSYNPVHFDFTTAQPNLSHCESSHQNTFVVVMSNETTNVSFVLVSYGPGPLDPLCM